MPWLRAFDPMFYYNTFCQLPVSAIGATSQKASIICFLQFVFRPHSLHSTFTLSSALHRNVSTSNLTLCTVGLLLEAFHLLNTSGGHCGDEAQHLLHAVVLRQEREEPGNRKYALRRERHQEPWAYSMCAIHASAHSSVTGWDREKLCALDLRFWALHSCSTSSSSISSVRVTSSLSSRASRWDEAWRSNFQNMADTYRCMQTSASLHDNGMQRTQVWVFKQMYSVQTWFTITYTSG